MCLALYFQLLPWSHLVLCDTRVHFKHSSHPHVVKSGGKKKDWQEPISLSLTHFSFNRINTSLLKAARRAPTDNLKGTQTKLSSNRKLFPIDNYSGRSIYQCLPACHLGSLAHAIAWLPASHLTAEWKIWKIIG